MTQDERDALVLTVGRLDHTLQRATQELERIKAILMATDEDDSAASAPSQQQNTTPKPPAQQKKKLVVRDPAMRELVDQHRKAKEEQLKRRETEAAAESVEKPRAAPYPVVIEGISHIPYNDKWSLQVYDKKYDESTEIPVPSDQGQAIRTAMRGGKRLAFEMSQEELAKAEWLPGNSVPDLDEPAPEVPDAEDATA